MSANDLPPTPVPPLHNVERWWVPDALSFLQRLRTAIETVTEGETATHTLLSVAFCRTLISLSNASFSHQSMSFKAAGAQLSFDVGHDLAAVFYEDVKFVLDGAADNPRGECTVIEGDARTLPDFLNERFDLVITSPPYANRMSYIRELRPYMYWLGYLTKARDAGELDWASIGGTWGVATSRLTDWKPDRDAFACSMLDGVLRSIAHEGHANGGLLANYVARYFEDVWHHLKGLRRVLAHDAQVHYIVGNSTFYGVLLPVERVYAWMMRELGFDNVDVTAVRKRNSKKDLIEFDVSATWSGSWTERQSDVSGDRKEIHGPAPSLATASLTKAASLGTSCCSTSSTTQ